MGCRKPIRSPYVAANHQVLVRQEDSTCEPTSQYLCGRESVTQSGSDAAKAALNCRTRELLTPTGNGASLTFLPSDGKAVLVSGLRG